MNFADPQFLTVTLVLAPLTAWFLWWTWRRKQRAAQAFIRSRLFAQLTVGLAPWRQILKRTLLGLAVVTILIALARPQWGFTEEETIASGLDIIVCADVSKSMLADDVKPSRLARLKLAAHDLLGLSRSDRLGLVAFAGNAFLQCPLALDGEAFRQSVQALDTDLIPVQGTALAEAIKEASAAFGADSTGAKAIVVLTDGEDHEPGAVEAARAASENGIRVFTLGVGSAEGAVLRSSDPYGNAVFIRDESGNAVRSRLNEAALKEIADAGGGFYLPLQNRQTIQTLFERGLDALPKADLKSGRQRQWIERFQWPLGLAILLLIAEIMLPEQRRGIARRVPGVMLAGAAPK